MTYQGKEWYSREACEQLFLHEYTHGAGSMAEFLKKHLNLAFCKGYQIGYGEAKNEPPPRCGCGRIADQTGYCDDCMGG